MMKKFLHLVLGLSLVLVLAACGSSEAGSDNGGGSGDSIQLSYAFFSPEKTYPGVVSKKWADELNDRTDGKVNVDIYYGGTLLDANNMLDGVKNNIADIGVVALSYEPGRFPLEEIAEITRGYSTAEIASNVMNTLIEEYPSEILEQYEVVGVFTTDAMAIHSTSPINSLDAIKGKQIRIGGALTPVLEELGGAPVGMSQAEQAQALQTGIISGYVSDRGGLQDMGFAELVSHVTDYPLAVTTLVVIMNKDKFESMPEDVQTVITELKDEVPTLAGQYLDEHTKGVLEWSAEEHGVEVVEVEDRAQWDEKIDSLRDEYIKAAEEKGYPAKEYAERAEELIAQYSN